MREDIETIRIEKDIKIIQEKIFDFDLMMKTALEQVKNGETMPCKEAFDILLREF